MASEIYMRFSAEEIYSGEKLVVSWKIPFDSIGVIRYGNQCVHINQQGSMAVYLEKTCVFSLVVDGKESDAICSEIKVKPSFTPDLYPDLKLLPISSYKLAPKSCSQGVIVCLIVVFGYIGGYLGWNIGYYLNVSEVGGIIGVLIGVLIVCAIISIRNDNVRSFLNSVDYYSSKKVLPDDFTVIAKDGKLGIFSEFKRKIVLHPMCTDLQVLNKHLIKLINENQYGLFSLTSGKLLLTIQYSDIDILTDKLVVVRKNNKCGVYNLNLCKFVIPVEFEDVTVNEGQYIICARNSSKKCYFDYIGNQMS